MKTTIVIDERPDPQAQPAAGFCPTCGGEVYAPSCQCHRCFKSLAELSADYRNSAVPLRRRLHQLRKDLSVATDPEEIWHLRLRIQNLTPLLTQVNELAELTEHYYERGYWRNEKYTF
ncbi:MAG: hypothetical protein E7466_06775 [Ruminococcaceae bacterium]|nr:hypothetical protein [Oscillospiraceae bacterium]MBQ3214571.1 hypothetical protein [Oscillospiraceae bacterium]